MTPTLNQIAFSLFHLIRPRVANSEVISLDGLKFDIENTRELLIRNEQNKNRTVTTDIIQDLGDVEMEPVDRAELCDTTVDCTFLRSKLPLPSPIELHHSDLIIRVGPLDKIARGFDRIAYERVPFEFMNKFTKHTIKWFRMNNNGYIYLAIHPDNKKAKSIRHINVQGVWADVEAVRNFQTCEGKPCYNDNMSYPVKAWMVNNIKTFILEKYLGKEAAAAIDESGDFNNNPIQQTSAKK